MRRRRYLLKPPSGFCAPFIVWAESKALARRYAAQWLGRELPASTIVLKFVSADDIAAMLAPKPQRRFTRTPAYASIALR